MFTINMVDIGRRNVSRSRMRSRLLICLVIIVLFLGIASNSAQGYPSYPVPVKIMPLGNSITVGIGDDVGEITGYRDHLYYSLEGDGYDVDFVGSQSGGSFPEPEHEGHSGKTARWINGWNNDKTAPRSGDNITDWLIDYDPNIVLYFIGNNDLGPYGLTPSVVADDVNETLDKIYGYDPEITVVLAQIILDRDDTDLNVKIHDYNVLLDDLATTWDSNGFNIVLVDMENALLYADYADPVHPNDQGYQKMADIWYAALLEVLPPSVSNPEPSDGATDVPVTTNALNFTIADPDGDPMDYYVTTSPDIGSTSGTGVTNGVYSLTASEYEIYDDDETFWQAHRVGSGGYDIALSEETTEKTNGTSSLKMTVASGSYVNLGVFHTYGVGREADWSVYDYLSLYVYGANTGLTVKVHLYTDPTNSAYWTFTDDFTGWRKLTFPLGSPHGEYGSLDLSRVNKIYLVYMGVNQPFVGYLDRTALDFENWLDYGVTYKWHVNVTDGIHWTNTTYTFTAETK